jgi:hypothetical protein
LSAAAARQHVCKSQRAARAAVELGRARRPGPATDAAPRELRQDGDGEPLGGRDRNLPLYRIKRAVRDCQFARAA